MKNRSNLSPDELNSFAEAAVKYNLEKKLKEKYGKILAEQNQDIPKKKKIFPLGIITRIAAILVLVIGSIFLFQTYAPSPTSTEMAQNYVDQTKILGNPDITRKGNSSASEIQRDANDAFVLQNFSLAIDKYEELKTTGSISSLDKFYLGASYLKTKKYEDAISIFEEIKSSNSKMVEEVDWYLSLSYILSNKSQDAKPLLMNIVSKNKYKTMEAKKLLQKLN